MLILNLIRSNKSGTYKLIKGSKDDVFLLLVPLVKRHFFTGTRPEG